VSVLVFGNVPILNVATGNSTTNKLITPFLVAFSLTSFAGALVNAATVVTHSSYADRDANIKTVTLWLGESFSIFLSHVYFC
jgi:hypothetical protein